MPSDAQHSPTRASDDPHEMGVGDLVGRIRHRLLINRWVDPAEVAPLLPEGVRPKLGANGGVIVGCCLIALDDVRPWPVPGIVGPSIRAAAHRISVEVGPTADPTSAVYVPMRHTDSRSTTLIGGRIFPGVHRRSTVEAACSRDSVSWRIQPNSASHGSDFAIRAAASREHSTPARSEEAEIVIGTFLGLSPDHGGALEGAEMQPYGLEAESLTLTDLSSEFLERFSSAQEADTLLMTDVGVTWRRASADLVNG